MRRRSTGRRKRLNVVYLVLAMAAGFSTCALGQVDSARRLNQADTVKATQVLSRWYECMGCRGNESEPELKAVKRYGQPVVPSLAATLSGGLSPASRQVLHDLLAARYDQLDEQGQNNPKFRMKSTKEEFIARYLDNLDTRYRIRAAQALGAIGGSRARTGLETALAQTQNAEVRKAAQEALRQVR